MQARILPCGDSALTVQFAQSIDAATNARVIELAARLERMALPGLLEIVPTYCALLLCYDPEQLSGTALRQILHDMDPETAERPAPRRRWQVPCLYGGEVGQDLDELARCKDLSPAQVVALHSGAEYRVYMIGFAPGFAYLGGLPEALHMPRLARPRQLVPAGAIGIGGQQASINSVAGPSGWRYIGWTPLRSFDPARAEPFLFRAGDCIRFRPVDAAEAEALAARVARGETVIHPETAA